MKIAQYFFFILLGVVIAITLIQASIEAAPQRIREERYLLVCSHQTSLRQTERVYIFTYGYPWIDETGCYVAVEFTSRDTLRNLCESCYPASEERQRIYEERVYDKMFE